MSTDDYSGLNCPLPISNYPNILLAHGGGGKLMHQLIDNIFIPAFGSSELTVRHDGARLSLPNNKVVMTTDSYVVYPLFFPGGDIGSLAVNGTVNDLAMCGARPLYLSAGFIIEEGLPTETLWKIAVSMRRAADAAGVQIVTGDTKVVDKGKGHGLFINTAGVGVLEHNLIINPASVRPYDAVILNGDIGRHGMTIMATREGLSFETSLESDCAPVSAAVMKLIEGGIDIHCLRDLTRGGLATSLVEIAEASHLHIAIDEPTIPVHENVRGACEILGFDPIYVANEGRFVAFVPQAQANKAISLLRSCSHDLEPQIIGQVSTHQSGLVTMKGQIGTERIIDMLSGEQLPRIC